MLNNMKNLYAIQFYVTYKICQIMPNDIQNMQINRHNMHIPNMQKKYAKTKCKICKQYAIFMLPNLKLQ